MAIKTDAPDVVVEFADVEELLDRHQEGGINNIETAARLYEMFCKMTPRQLEILVAANGMPAGALDKIQLSDLDE